MSVVDKDALIATLQDEVAALRTVISLTPGNVYWKNRDNKYLGCNNNVSALLNFISGDDIIGKSAFDILPPDLAKQIDQNDLDVITSGKEICLEEEGFNSTVYLSRKVPLLDRQGNVQGMLGISFDITERKKFEDNLRIAKEKAETANRAKSQFLAMISHELRTPLSSILGFASLMENATLTEEKKQEYIGYITSSGSYLLSLINSLLDYNKLESNKFKLALLPLNLKELIENVVSMLSGTAKLKNLPLSFEYDKDVPQNVISNNRALRQILINLIGNAIKFTDKGHVIIKVTCLKKTNQHAQVKIAIEDTGIGIPPNKQRDIFKRFYQLGNVYTRNASLTGTGLGLSIVKKLAKLLKAKIEVKSNQTCGTTFSFTINFQTTVNTHAPWLPYASNVKILVVQDHMGRININAMLANSQYDSVSSKEAMGSLLSAYRSLQAYDIVIIDEDITFTNPIELMENVRKQSDLQQPLGILLTSHETQPNSLFTEIKLLPTSNNICEFQEKLKFAWENWLEQSKRFCLDIERSQNPYVLLVEDNPLIQIVHKHMLEELGCRVDISDSANTALNMLTNKYEMLFVDIGLPDIAGFKLIQKIRNVSGLHSQMPIVVLTGYSEDEERERCLRMGANEVAIKPISKDTLKNILERYIPSN